MRKVFPLELPGHKPPRVVAAIKNDVRKYLKRERRKQLPEDADYWDFDCRVGKDRDDHKSTHVAELTSAIDAASAGSWANIYIEILAKPAVRAKKPSEPGSEA